MRCDTCGREVDKVKRVVVAEGYDRIQAVTIFNCEECFKKKEAARQQKGKENGAGA